MKKYLQLTSQLVDKFDNVKLELILREENSTADKIARLALTEDTSAMEGLLMEVQTTPSIDRLQAISIQQQNNWMEPIISYIRDGQLPSDSSEAKKVNVRATRFIVLNRELYKREFLMLYLKCLAPNKATYVLREKHEGACGNHSGPQSLVGKMIRASYFWLTMQKDAVEFVKKCDKCQRFGNVQHIPGELLVSISSPWPFSTYGIDIVGPLPLGKRQVKFLLVTIDYFTKWVEAKPLAVITKDKIQTFVWKNIVCWFRIPRMIVSHNGHQFNS